MVLVEAGFDGGAVFQSLSSLITEEFIFLRRYFEYLRSDGPFSLDYLRRELARLGAGVSDCHPTFRLRPRPPRRGRSGRQADMYPRRNLSCSGSLCG
jgi:hypothetical protein